MPTNSPSLTLPKSESVSAGGTIAIAGIDYVDSFAAGNPGAMYLHISDGSGELSADNAAGVTVVGSGSNGITLSVTYANVAAVLASLDYTAAPTAGSDTISFDLWDQAGVETTGTIPVTIGATASATDTWTGAVSTAWNTGGNWSTGAPPLSGETANIPGSTPNQASLSNATLTGEAITLTLGGNVGPTVNFNNVTLGSGTVLTDTVPNADQGPTLQLTGTLTVGAGAGMTDPDGLLVLDTTPGTTTPAVVVNQATISGDGGHLNIDTGGSIVNNGLIIASGGGGVGFNLGQFQGEATPETILNAGTLEAANGTIYLNGTVDGGTVLFSGTGGLVLEQPDALQNGATIVGFGANDSITIDQVTATSLSFGNGTLTVVNGGTVVESLPMRGNYTTANFSMVFQPSDEPSWVISYVATSPPPPSGAQISVPASEQVAAGGTIAMGGVSVTDAFAAANPGLMALNVTDTSGMVSLTTSSGATIAGSQTNAIHYAGTLNQINAALASLTYVAGTSASSGSITVDVWDQAGREATEAIPVTITGSAPVTSEMIGVTPGMLFTTANQPGPGFSLNEVASIADLPTAEDSGTLGGTTLLPVGTGGTLLSPGADTGSVSLLGMAQSGEASFGFPTHTILVTS